MLLEECSRVNILGVGVSAIDMEEAVKRTDVFLQGNGKGYICVTGVHGITEAQSDQRFRAILNRSIMTTPDGMPTVWIGKILGNTRMERVYGPDYMLGVCQMSVKRGYRHFLYGGKDGVAQQLGEELKRIFPGLILAGHYTPPFRPLDSFEEAELIARVADSNVDILWVGLSTPKQERFMYEYLSRLDTRIMIGVGAAFDIHTGRIEDAPSWVKRLGMQWLHRLIQEPRRLWRRYLINNPSFIWRVLLQLLSIQKYSLEE